MTPGRFARLAKMDRGELLWRGGAALRGATDRARAMLSPPEWSRVHLSRILASMPQMAAVRRAARHECWADAHRALAEYFSTAPAQFVIAPTKRAAIRSRIVRQFPDCAGDAAARADRLLSGEYDLLGYRGLRFDLEPGSSQRTQRRNLYSSCPSWLAGPARINWHYDPVHDREAPCRFWTTVPYLDPICGDHKIIWELNRHQHWLSLGRAYWLTGDERYRRHALSELAGWLDANPPLTGINWASMLELGFRSLSWVWALNFFAAPERDDEPPWLVDLIVGLDRQLDHVSRNLSYYFSPNTHLLGEALALFVTGRSLPFLARSQSRAAVGRAILVREASRQIAVDGGHRERSTHYHRYALDFYILALAVARITHDEAAADFERTVARLGYAARVLADDGGRLPHIGDDDGGATVPLTGRAVDDIRDSLAEAAALTGRPDLRVGAAPEEAFWILAHGDLADALDASQRAPANETIGSAALPDTGYYVSRSGAGDHLVIDGGAHGYQNAGHAHADALALTLTLGDLPFLIDPGTGCYTSDPLLRDRLRSTALHNTVAIDEQPQSIPSGPFHWRRAAGATIRRWRTNPGFDYFEAAHDGYFPVEHRRHVLSVHQDLLIVADLVVGEGVHRADAHWHVDPRWQIVLSGHRAAFTAGGHRAELAAPQGLVDLLVANEETGLGYHSPVYGRLEPASTLRITLTGNAPAWIVSVFGLHRTNAVIDAEIVPVWADAGALRHSLALRISRTASIDYFLIADPGDFGSGTRGGSSRQIWRLGDVETDARALLCRAYPEGYLARVAMVDGSLVRTAGHPEIGEAICAG